MNDFDVIVIGGGHAGVEAAAAAARMGVMAAIISFTRESIGMMSCNPAIGGLGKGHLVREVDALDGIIGRASDRAAIHYRMLNSSKGKNVFRLTLFFKVLRFDLCSINGDAENRIE